MKLGTPSSCPAPNNLSEACSSFLLELPTVVVDPVFYQPFRSFLPRRFPSYTFLHSFTSYLHPYNLHNNLIAVNCSIKRPKAIYLVLPQSDTAFATVQQGSAGEYIATLQPCHIYDTPLLGIPSSTQSHTSRRAAQQTSHITQWVSLRNCKLVCLTSLGPILPWP
jgi:hypothetical protein